MRDANDSPLRIKEMRDMADDAREARLDKKYNEILHDMRLTCKSFGEALAALKSSELDAQHVLGHMIAKGNADNVVKMIASIMAIKELSDE